MALSVINQAAVENSRYVRSGKDGGLYNGNGVLLASMESFQAQFNVNNQKFQPLGSNQEFEANVGYGVTLTFSEIVVEDNQFINEMIEYQNTGVIPDWTFQGVIRSLTGKSEERMVYPRCIPSGNIDIQNLSTGDILKRAWSLYVNGKVAQQGKLAAN
jgi:hypothetical protein